MELHSYAKLRGYKKWTIEQKRKLVEARINYDGIFSRKSANCMDSWKKIMAAAKLTEFNVCFVRKQWANLLARYKVYKRTRLRQLGKSGGELNDQIVREISEEWEFFYPIHSFMSRKTTNFHSYAQTPRATDDKGADNDEKNDGGGAVVPPPNTDHDFYSKSARHEILDIRMEALDEPSPPPPVAATTSAVPNSIKPSNGEQEKVQNQASASAAEKPKKKRKPSERDKYYKHKRRYDRRNERRIDALLNVFGQVIKEHYPNVDTSRLKEQSDQVSTEEDDVSTLSMCSVDSAESTCTAPTSASEGSGL